MTRKDYEAIAEIFSAVEKERPRQEVGAILAVMRGLADYFEKDNPRFDRDRFVEACRRK